MAIACLVFVCLFWRYKQVYETLLTVQDKDVQTVLEFLHNTYSYKLTNDWTESDAQALEAKGNAKCQCMWRR